MEIEFVINAEKKIVMRAILKYNLEDKEDRMAHLRAVKSLDLASCLWDVQNAIRRLDKHFDIDHIEEIKNHLLNHIGDINLDELIE